MASHWLLFLFYAVINKVHGQNICANYGNYDTIDGVDKVINIEEEVIYVNLNDNYTNTFVASVAERTGDTFNCTDPNGCNYVCNNSAACFDSKLYCNSPIGCNVICDGNFACSKMNIHGKTNITIVCYRDSCEEMKVNLSGMTSAHLHCSGDEACQKLEIRFENMDYNNLSSSVSCYTKNACPDLKIYTNDPSIQLKMYEYSENVEIHTYYGFLEVDKTILCGLNDKYIQINESDLDYTIQQLVGLKYPEHKPYSNLYPEPNPAACSDITIFCDELNGLSSAHSCLLEYIYNDRDLSTFKDELDFVNETCINVELSDMIHLGCYGTCQGSPTRSPTQKPTSAPTIPPSYAPSTAPTITPTIAPSSSPTYSPLTPTSPSPSYAPSAVPTITPTITPTFSPTIYPTFSPSLTPTYSPTMAPTRYPTTQDEYNELDSKIDIVYKLNNLITDNYDLIKDYRSNNVIEDMEEILEMNYFDTIYLSKYSYFQVIINQINGIEIDEAKFLNLADDGTIFIKSTILLQSIYSFEIIVRSEDPSFLNTTRHHFRQYFNNANLNFSVVDASQLVAEKLYPEANDDSGITLWEVIVILLSIAIVIIGVILFKRKFRKRSLINDTSQQNDEHPKEVEGQTMNSSNMIYGEIDNEVAAPAEGRNNDSDDSSIDEELNNYRDEFRKAMSIIKKEQKKQKGNDNRIDYNRWTFILQENNIQYDIIEEVLQYVKKSQQGIEMVSNGGNKHGSDIDMDSDEELHD